MAELKVKVENLPTRCEVCHQSDLFDPQSNYCVRCKDTTALIARSLLFSSQKKESTLIVQPVTTSSESYRSLIQLYGSSLIIYSLFLLIQIESLFSKPFLITRIASITIFSGLVYSAIIKIYYLRKNRSQSDLSDVIFLRDNWLNLVFSLCMTTYAIESIGNLITKPFSYYALLTTVLAPYFAYSLWKTWRNNRRVSKKKISHEEHGEHQV